jgi:hypothetical protein
MVLIYQPPNAHVRISGILPSNAMAGAAVKKIYWEKLLRSIKTGLGMKYTEYYNSNPVLSVNAQHYRVSQKKVIQNRAETMPP